jgi:hypothetical protein
MLRLGCVVLAMSTTFVAAAPPGKVVRVERARTKKTASPILCEVKPDLSGQCIGGKPAEGDVVSVVNGQKIVAEVRILTMTPASPQCDAMWHIKTAKLSGDLTSGRHQEIVGVVDTELEARGKYVKDPTENRNQIPNADPSTKAMMGIDRDGNGSSDIVLTWARCPGTGTGGTECLEIWSRRDRTMVRTWTANLTTCY